MSAPNPTGNQSPTGEIIDASGQKIALNTVLLGVTEFMTRLISLALIILVARRLGPAVLGIYAFALGLIRVCDIFLNFGLDRYLQREVGRQPERAGPLFSQVFVLKSGVYLLCLGVIFCLTFLIIHEPLKRWVVWVLTLALFFRTHTASITALFRARQKASYEASVVITMRLIYGASGLAAILAGQGLLTLVLLELGAQAVACLVAFSLFQRKIASLWHPFTWSQVRQLVTTAKDFFLIRLVLTLSSSLNLLLLSFLAGDLATGFYAAALRLTASFDFLPEAFTGAFLPVISRQARDNWQRFVAVFQHYFKYLLILGLGLTAILSSLAPGIIPFVFGPAFLPAIPVLSLLALVLALEFINLSLTNALIAFNAEETILKNFSVVLVLNLLANLLLIPAFQAQGAAWAAVLAEGLVLVLQFKALGQERLGQLRLGALAWRPLMAGLVTFGGGRLLMAAHIPFPAVLALTGLGFLLGLIATGALSRYELDTLKTWAGEGRHAQ